jgi:hypothetical protein
MYCGMQYHSAMQRNVGVAILCTDRPYQDTASLPLLLRMIKLHSYYPQWHNAINKFLLSSAACSTI